MNGKPISSTYVKDVSVGSFFDKLFTRLTEMLWSAFSWWSKGWATTPG